ncbi:hypothetical protein P4H39_01470 [Paenibacillus lautus]|uniref:hypothetical protein n=1 Tax=Paenibacillus lautus TaxID=1401 RepID=UPI002DB57000|nr:hypothetical protein [Paenibacillus lautus]MEC0201293.1 hypothetical protein [Paenibacillus lautus]
MAASEINSPWIFGIKGPWFRYFFGLLISQQYADKRSAIAGFSVESFAIMVQ